MTNPPEDKDWKVVYSNEVNEKLDSDPEMVWALRDLTSRLRQAMHDFEAGKFSSCDEAMRSVGGEKVDPDEIPDEVIAAMTKRKRPQ